jgi:hypothetical protein
MIFVNKYNIHYKETAKYKNLAFFVTIRDIVGISLNKCLFINNVGKSNYDKITQAQKSFCNV